MSKIIRPTCPAVIRPRRQLQMGDNASRAWQMVQGHAGLGFIGSDTSAPVPSFRAVGTSGYYDSGTTSWVAPGLPSGTTAGDFLHLTLFAYDSGTVATATPSGWTLVGIAGASTRKLGVYTRIVTGSGDAPTITSWSSVIGSRAVIMGFTGATSVEAANTTAFALGNNVGTLPYDTITTIGANRLVVEAFSAQKNDTSLTGGTPDASWTERFERWDNLAASDVTQNETLVAADTMPKASAGAVSAANRTYNVAFVGGNNSLRVALALVP